MIVIADVHFDKVSDSIIRGNDEPSQVEDTLQRLYEASAAAHDDDRTLIIAGDVFNRVNPSTSMIARFFEFLANCRRNQVDVYIIPGNHDCGLSWANVAMVDRLSLDNVVVVTSIVTRNIMGRQVTFIPHLPIAQVRDIESEYGSLAAYLRKTNDTLDVVIGHGMLRSVDYANEIFYEAGRALEIDADAMPKFNVMVLGHVHKYTRVDTSSGPVIYPGAVKVTNFDEVEDRRGMVVIGPKTFRWTSYKTEITPYVFLDIDLVKKDEIDLSDFTVKRIGSGAVMKIRVRTTSRMRVDEVAIRRAFNRVGYVSRFETVVVGDGSEASTSPMTEDLDYGKILSDWVKRNAKEQSAAVRKRAVELGQEIIVEALSD